MLWLETSILLLLFLLIAVGALAVVLVAGRRQGLPSSSSVGDNSKERDDENVITLEGGGGKKKKKGHIRKRKAATTEGEGIDDFMVIERVPGNDEEQHHVAEPSLSMPETTEEPIPAVEEEEGGEAINDVSEQTPLSEITTETYNDTTMNKEMIQHKEKKPIPQSPPLPQPPTEEEPLRSVQERFLSGCQNASKCAECDQTFTLLFRRHHCRRCFRSVCASCSVNFVTLEGFNEPVRVCTSCSDYLSSIERGEGDESPSLLLSMMVDDEDPIENTSSLKGEEGEGGEDEREDTSLLPSGLAANM